MCLTSKSNKLEVAEKDIVCYKCMAFDELEELFRTPYQYVSIEKEIISGKKPFCAKGGLKKFKDKDGNICFEGGLIHTFKSLKDAKELCDFWREGVIFKCIIPKGTKYVLGQFESFINDYCTSYASKKIIFKGIVYNGGTIERSIKKKLGLI